MAMDQSTGPSSFVPLRHDLLSQKVPIDVKFEPSWLVYLAVLCAQMSAISMGASFGWSAPALEDMLQWNETPFRPNESQASWIASFLLIGSMAGGAICGFCIDYFGRRRTLIALGLPYSAGWLLIGLSQSLAPILIGRILTGFSLGITFGVLPCYIAEISTADTRGMLGMTFEFFIVSGTLFMDLVYIGNVHWNQLAYWALVPALLLSVSMLLMPESPSWIVNHCKDNHTNTKNEQALDSLRRLRTSRSDIYQELDLLVESSTRVQHSSNSKLRWSLSTLRRADVYKPMSIGVALHFFQQFSGLNAVQFYANQIFEDSGSSMEPKISLLISNGGMLAATIVGALIIDRFGRRILIMISATGMMLSIGTLGGYYHQNPSIAESNNNTFVTPSIVAYLNDSLLLQSQTTLAPISIDQSIRNPSILPVICLTLYFASFSLGLGPIVWIIITEITPPQTIGLISTVSSIMGSILTFLVVNELDHMFHWFSPQGTYWIFATICSASVVFAYYLPETKGKTMNDIVEIFNYEH